MLAIPGGTPDARRLTSCKLQSPLGFLQMD